jgi:hypothetical protein
MLVLKIQFFKCLLNKGEGLTQQLERVGMAILKKYCQRCVVATNGLQWLIGGVRVGWGCFISKGTCSGFLMGV